MKLIAGCALGLVAIADAVEFHQIVRRQNNDTEVRVVLSSQATETGAQVAFDSVTRREYEEPAGSGALFETIEVRVGAGAQQDLRCQAIGLGGMPLVATRGENVDLTFSDAGKGAWTFRVPSAVGEIICDPAFEAVDGTAFQVRVILSNPAAELGTQTVFEDSAGRAQKPPTGSEGPFHTVEISVGELVNPNLRCQILNKQGVPIIATRGANTDVTFSDAEKGPWRLMRMSKVSQIICDPNFVARPQ